jgi:hypothetical protein
MKLKSSLAMLLRVIGGVLAVPSLLALFFGALALRLLPWFPSFESVFEWAAGLALAALVGSAFLKQAEIWHKEAKNPMPSERDSNEPLETTPPPKHLD